MPNWCYQEQTFYSEKLEPLQNFHDKICHFTSIPACDNVYDNNKNWLGNILCHCGFSYADVMANRYGYPRSWVDSIEDIEYDADNQLYYFIVTSESAWSPKIRPWTFILKALTKEEDDIHMAFLAEESGNAIFLKSDDDYFYTNFEYNVDCYIPYELENNFKEKFPELTEENGAYKATDLFKLFQTENIEEIMRRAEEITDALQAEFDDGYYYINRYEVVEGWELD